MWGREEGQRGDQEPLEEDRPKPYSPHTGSVTRAPHNFSEPLCPRDEGVASQRLCAFRLN